MNEREQARRIFRTPEGQDYLIRLLSGMHVFDMTLSEKDLGERNAGMRILKTLGLLDETNIRRLIKHFFSLDIDSIEKKEAEANVKKAMDYLGGIIPGVK